MATPRVPLALLFLFPRLRRVWLQAHVVASAASDPPRDPGHARLKVRRRVARDPWTARPWLPGIRLQSRFRWAPLHAAVAHGRLPALCGPSHAFSRRCGQGSIRASVGDETLAGAQCACGADRASRGGGETWRTSNAQPRRAGLGSAPVTAPYRNAQGVSARRNADGDRSKCVEPGARRYLSARRRLHQHGIHATQF